MRCSYFYPINTAVRVSVFTTLVEKRWKSQDRHGLLYIDQALAPTVTS
jgi:hypothetical protein